MLIFPAIDIRDGKCVRLYQGKFDSSNVVAEDPVSTAIKFKKEGASFLHVVDLDGALNGKVKNREIISKIASIEDLSVELGGGIRSIETIDELLELGLDRVILGTSALSDKAMVTEAVKKYGDKIVVGIDARDEKVAVKGWVEVSDIDYIEFGKQMEDIGVKTLIFTDISRDGTLSGTNMDQLLKLKNAVNCNVVASGGIKNIDDIKELKKKDAYGVIIGKAIYSKTLSLKEAIEIGGN